MPRQEVLVKCGCDLRSGRKEDGLVGLCAVENR